MTRGGSRGPSTAAADGLFSRDRRPRHTSDRPWKSTKSGVETRCEFLFPAPPAAARASRREGGRAVGHTGGHVHTLFPGSSDGCRTPTGDPNGELCLPVTCGDSENGCFPFYKSLVNL